MTSNFLFTGDSITCANRLWVPGKDGLGQGYVSILAPEIKRRFPDAHIRNMGYDGFTVPALLRRLSQTDAPEGADFVSLLIGINDVGVAAANQVSLSALNFSQNYQQLLSLLQTRHPRAKIVTAGPFVFPCPREFENWFPLVKDAEAIMAQAAKEKNIPFLPLHDRLNKEALQKGYAAVTTDGVHLTNAGHEFLASIWLPYLTSL